MGTHGGRSQAGETRSPEEARPRARCRRTGGSSTARTEAAARESRCNPDSGPRGLASLDWHCGRLPRAHRRSHLYALGGDHREPESMVHRAARRKTAAQLLALRFASLRRDRSAAGSSRLIRGGRGIDRAPCLRHRQAHRRAARRARWRPLLDGIPVVHGLRPAGADRGIGQPCRGLHRLHRVAGFRGRASQLEGNNTSCRHGGLGILAQDDHAAVPALPARIRTMAGSTAVRRAAEAMGGDLRGSPAGLFLPPSGHTGCARTGNAQRRTPSHLSHRDSGGIGRGPVRQRAQEPPAAYSRPYGTTFRCPCCC